MLGLLNIFHVKHCMNIALVKRAIFKVFDKLFINNNKKSILFFWNTTFVSCRII